MNVVIVGPLISSTKLLGNISRKFAVDSSQKRTYPVNLILFHIGQINLLYVELKLNIIIVKISTFPY